VREIPLRSRKYPGKVALVDDSDWAVLSAFSWAPDKRGPLFYARATIDGRKVYMHRLLRPDLPEIDHEDGNGLNNQRYNLRETTRAQQLQNRAKEDGPLRSPVYKGVSRTGNVRNPWKAEITVPGIPKHIGVFPTAEDAARAYDTAARKAFGPYARTNFEQMEES
jgi:hypothetical protein